METAYNVEQVERILGDYQKVSNVAQSIGNNWAQEVYSPSDVKTIVERNFPEELQPIVKRILINNFPNKGLEGVLK